MWECVGVCLIDMGVCLSVCVVFDVGVFACVGVFD